MSGDVQVRFCEHLGVQFPRVTHLVMGFQYEADARKMMVALRERLAAFGLMLHEEKTRLLEFGQGRAIQPTAAKAEFENELSCPPRAYPSPEPPWLRHPNRRR